VRALPAVKHAGRTQPIGARPVAGAIVVLAVLSLLVLKPWSSPGPAERATLDDAEPSRAPAAIGSPVTAVMAGGRSKQCEFSAGWRVFVAEGRDPSVEYDPGRRWLAVEPLAEAGSPVDGAIPWVQVFAPTQALGYCAPTPAAGGPPPGVTVSAWEVGAGGTARPVSLLDVASSSEPDDGSEGLFAPSIDGSSDGSFEPPGAPTPGNGWPEGRYVLRISDASGYARWFGVDLRYRLAGAPADPSATPATAAGASPHPTEAAVQP
jgi:hypothetical protein